MKAYAIRRKRKNGIQRLYHSQTKGKIKGRGYNNLCRFILDLCFLNNYLLAVIITALGAKSVRSLEFTAV